MASFSDDPTTLSPGSSTPISSAPLTQSPTDPYANPLYLHTADSSSLILVSEKLVGDSNYNIWSRSVEKALLAKNKLGFVRGTIPKPSPNHPDAGSWDRCNALISTWITNVVSTEIASLIVYMGDAATVWTILETRFKQKNAAKIYNIQHRLDSLHQGSMDLNSYFTKMTSLWKELKNHEPFPVCTCVSQEEQQRLTLPGNSDVVVFQTGPHFSSDKSRPILPTPPSAHYQPESRPIIFCSHCGLSGHLVSKCFKLHGYPANYRGPSSTPRQAYQSKNRNYGHDRKQNHVNFINNSTDNPVHASLSATSGKASLARTVLASPVNVSVSGFEQLSS
ncbi:PREDICTED: uncharacterized protein LOC104816811 isoform X2 [Tarenaya hassleriana]|uniref:uncharacterized protein LOC104816811 isoform X2 n=1 Tax=Tarenaya hassleriana TaxID=28532 RepID=UPI00053C9EBA|nr:PREDICTED: uncharacterized protein LOC104816811 isoform X2 [Tarenaya hassleriana]